MQQNILWSRQTFWFSWGLQPLENLWNCSWIYPKMFLTDFIFRQQENLADNQKCQAGSRPLCNKILFLTSWCKAHKREVGPHWRAPVHPHQLSKWQVSLQSLWLRIPYLGIKPRLSKINLPRKNREYSNTQYKQRPARSFLLALLASILLIWCVKWNK